MFDVKKSIFSCSQFLHINNLNDFHFKLWIIVIILKVTNYSLTLARNFSVNFYTVHYSPLYRFRWLSNFLIHALFIPWLLFFSLGGYPREFLGLTLRQENNNPPCASPNRTWYARPLPPGAAGTWFLPRTSPIRWTSPSVACSHHADPSSSGTSRKPTPPSDSVWKTTNEGLSHNGYTRRTITGTAPMNWIWQIPSVKQKVIMSVHFWFGLNWLTHSSIMTAGNPPLRHSLLDMKNLAGTSFFASLQTGMDVSALNGKAHPQEHRVHDPYAMTRSLSLQIGINIAWVATWGVSLGGQVNNFFQRTLGVILSLMDRAITSRCVPFESKAHRHDVWKRWERPIRDRGLVAKRKCLLSCIFNSNTDVCRHVFPF